jgi:transcriptional regulator with XRE-family HTH domain
MDFGLVVKNRRQELNMETVTLEKISGINHGTISRVENGRVNVLMRTAIILCKALKLDPIDIFDLTLKVNITTFTPPNKSKQYLDNSDINRLFALFADYPLGTLDKIMAITTKYTSAEIRDIFHMSEYWIKRAIDPRGDNLADLLKIIQNVPYPKKFENALILRINDSGGAISLLDFGHFVRNVRKGLSFSLMDVQEKSGLSDSSLSKLENSNYHWIKLSDILILDKVLKVKGDLLRLIWNVVEFKQKVTESKLRLELLPQDKIILTHIISVYRWIELQADGSDTRWLAEIRSLLPKQEESKHVHYSN